MWKPKKKISEGEQSKRIQGFDIDLNDEHLKRIDRLVDHYESEIVRQLESEYKKQIKTGDRVADKIAQFGGSWRFIIFFAVFLFIWMAWNTMILTSDLHFDGPPFILLNLCLSFIAAFQAPIIMMSQNRQAARDKHESIIDFAIDYKDGQEIDDIQRDLHRVEHEILAIKQILQEKQSDQ